MLLVGEHMSAQTAYERFGFVNAVVNVDKSESIESGQAIIEAEALRWAAKIVKNSPDAVMVTKEGLNLARDAGKEPHGIDEAAIKSFDGERSKALYDGDNIREGITAFFEVRSSLCPSHSLRFIQSTCIDGAPIFISETETRMVRPARVF